MGERRYERNEGSGAGQYIGYRFFRLDPAWRRLPIDERAAGKDAGDPKQSVNLPIRQVVFFVDGRTVCTARSRPFECSWDAGSQPGGRLFRGTRASLGRCHTLACHIAPRGGVIALLL
jgi:hypothetical protein